MEVFRELLIESDNPENLVALLFHLIHELPQKWIYKEDLVRNYISHAPSKKEVVCIQSPQIYTEEKTIQGLVWLNLSANQIKLMNIVPTKVGSLSKSEYNFILQKFYDEIISPFSKKVNLKIQLSQSKKTIEELAGEDTAKKLILFSRGANKLTGHSNPHDMERWMDFLCTSHKFKSNLSLEDLALFLEQDGWGDDEIISRLLIDYENGITLLKYHDSNY